MRFFARSFAHFESRLTNRRPSALPRGSTSSQRFLKPQIIGSVKVAPFPVTTNDGVKELLDKQSKECCHWDELALICHGGQKSIWYSLLKSLAGLPRRPTLPKFVLWMCNSPLEYCPNVRAATKGASRMASSKSFR